MPPIRRRFHGAALILFVLAAAGVPALAQNETSNSIGPPQLKDFSLPGQRTTPPAATPPAGAAPSTAPPRSAPAPAPATGGTERAPVPAARRDSRPAPAAATPAPAPQPAATAPRVETPIEAGPAAADPAASAPPEIAPAPQSAPRAVESSSPNWLWPAVGGILLLGLAALFLLRRRKGQIRREVARDDARDELGAMLVAGSEPEAPPEAPPQPAAAAPVAPRPWLELDIVPDRAAATDAEALVHYALTITNNGEVEARNIRIDPRLFNAGAEGDMMAFFQGPIHDQSGSPHIVIAPGGTLKLNGQVTMPKEELREIELGGRRIFVPMVAINVAYDWEAGGPGRTSRSWLVGREAQTPTEKMGPFRLDLGPRIYRTVGRREARLVMV